MRGPHQVLLEQLVSLAVGFTPLRRLDLDPTRRRAGKVEANAPFADDALKALLSGGVQKFLAIGEGVGQPQRVVVSLAQQRLELGLALLQRLRSQISTTEHQQIEAPDAEARGPPAHQGVKVWLARLVAGDELAVDDRVFRGQAVHSGRDGREAVGKFAIDTAQYDEVSAIGEGSATARRPVLHNAANLR